MDQILLYPEVQTTAYFCKCPHDRIWRQNPLTIFRGKRLYLYYGQSVNILHFWWQQRDSWETQPVAVNIPRLVSGVCQKNLEPPKEIPYFSMQRRSVNLNSNPLEPKHFFWPLAVLIIVCLNCSDIYVWKFISENGYSLNRIWNWDLAFSKTS